MRRVFFRGLNVFTAVLFAAAAAVQYNDPDPALWITVYGAGAMCCALYAADRLPVLLSRTTALLCLVGALYQLGVILFGPLPFLDPSGRAMMGIVEEGRELLGFLLTAGWTGFLTWRERQRSFVEANGR